MLEMSAEVYLLDTSAWLTLIEDESGADRVEKILRSVRVLVPWMVLLEIQYVTRRGQGENEADRRYAYIRNSPVDILWEIDEPILLTAARMKATHTISVADAMIAAYTQRYEAILVHKDPEFEPLSGEIRLETLPYK